MLTRTERKSIEKSGRTETKHNEKPGLFEVPFAELWRDAQQRRSAYIGLWIAQIFRQSGPRNKSSDGTKAAPPLRHVNSPR
jgi:hypothetical protein